MTADILLWIAFGSILLIVAVVLWPLMNLHIMATFSKAPIPFHQIVLMRLRGLDPKVIVICHIRAVKGISQNIPVSELISHCRAGGRLPDVINALIAAERGGFDLTWEEACIADLEGRDVLAEAQQRLDAIEATTA